ncbi:MAG TPA: RNA polymerase sigma factor [Gaiellaceae bacterium]
MAAEPSIGRAARVEGTAAPEADLTRALYEEYGNQIFRYCLHQLGSREEAEDAVQSTFLNAFRGIKRGIVPELESAWLFKIAQNVCLSRRRSTWRRDRIESPTDFELVEELTPAPSRRADELMGLQDVLEQMPESQRRAILLREWQGLSYREIADELDLSQAAVETLIFRARRALAQGLEQPPEPKRRRAVRGTDWGNVLAGLKSLLLGSGAAVKVAATVAVVGATSVVASSPMGQHRARPQTAPARPAVSSSGSTAAGASSGTVATSPAGTQLAARHRVARSHRVSALAARSTLLPDGGATATDQAAAVPAAPADPAPQAASAAPAPAPTATPAAAQAAPVEQAAAPVVAPQAAPAAAPANASSDQGTSDTAPGSQFVALPTPVTVTGTGTGTVGGTPSRFQPLPAPIALPVGAVDLAPSTTPAPSSPASSQGSSTSTSPGSSSTTGAGSSGTSTITTVTTPVSGTSVVKPIVTSLNGPPAGGSTSSSGK